MTTMDIAAKPRLRGWLHGAATPLAAAAGAWLWWQTYQRTEFHWSVLVFGVASVMLFGISATYHVGRWDERARYIWSRADVAMIVIFVAAAYTPIGTLGLDGAWRTWSLVIAWVIATVGAAIAASPVTGPRWLISGSYIAMGWLGIVPVAKLAFSIPWQSVALIVAGGLLFTIGGVVYARRRPDPWPHMFGFHEVFHLLVVAGVAAIFGAIWYLVG